MRGIKTNFMLNIVGPLLSLVVLLIATPIYIWYIGDERYGLLSIVWRLLGYLGFLDLGLSRASANALAKLAGSGSREERSNVLITALSMNFCLGIAGGIIFYFFGRLVIEHVLSLPGTLQPEIDTAFPWIACLLPLAFIGGLGHGALESRERFLASNVLQVAGQTLGIVLPVLCAVYISPSLTVVIPAAAIGRALSVVLTLGIALRGEAPLRLRNFDRQRCRTLLGYGGWVSFNNIAGAFLSSVDQLMIGSVLGVAAVAHYAVPMSLVVRSQLVAWALSRTLFPRMSRLTAAEATGLARKGMVTLAYAYGAICASALVLARPLLEFWMGPAFGSIAGPVAEILLIGAWTRGLGFILYALLEGQGRPDIVSKVLALETIPYVIVLWFLANRFGLSGAAASWDLLVGVEAAVLFASSRFTWAQLGHLLPPFGFILAAYLLVYFWHPGLSAAFLAAGAVGAGVCAGALLFDSSSREFVAALRFPVRLSMPLKTK